ncbi:class I SAM-dependent methyltransferase [Herbaspirillum camelliae]|uniref:class I SAM-dependent methyltransferase n=1 Tax=Herbaspirillum camelliae TaxID=1892903 RepID=UPI0009F94271|nr:methyltransferase domain-containing protein [Herbaspirillum camelliae]
MRFQRSLLMSFFRQCKDRTLVFAQNVGPLLFIRELFSNPATTGAPWPSSRQLGIKMAAAMPVGGSGLIVELGAGTGVVTQALLDHGVEPERLLIVERSQVLFEYLQKRFPQLRVVLADAADCRDFIPASIKIDAIVSSIPLRSLPFEDAETIVSQWCKLAPHGAWLVQFTYALWGPLRHLSSRFAFQDSAIAWLNFPPARVVLFKIG